MTIRNSAEADSKPSWARPFTVVLVVQVAIAFMMQLLPITAPVLIEARGWSEGAIGYLMAGTMVSATFFLLGSGLLLSHWGPLRTIQLGLMVAAVGAIILPVPLFFAPVLTGLLFGLVFGPNTPAGSEVLQRFVPPRHRALLFSIKQAGVPLGAALAGLVLPVLILQGGMTLAAGFTALLLLACAVLVQPFRQITDTQRGPGPNTVLHHGLVAQFKSPFRAFSQSPGLGRLAVVGGLLSAGQGVLNSFLMIYLVVACAFDLQLAGVIFAAMQLGGMVGRVVLGWLSDRVQSGLIVLRLNSLAAIGSMIFLATTGQNLSLELWIVMAVIVGMVVYGWNGVLLSEVARRAPSGSVADSTAGAVSLVFVGMMLGPATFALVHAVLGRFDLSFAVFSALPVIAFIVSYSIPTDKAVN